MPFWDKWMQNDDEEPEAETPPPVAPVDNPRNLPVVADDPSNYETDPGQHVQIDMPMPVVADDPSNYETDPDQHVQIDMPKEEPQPNYDSYHADEDDEAAVQEVISDAVEDAEDMGVEDVATEAVEKEAGEAKWRKIADRAGENAKYRRPPGQRSKISVILGRGGGKSGGIGLFGGSGSFHDKYGLLTRSGGRDMSAFGMGGGGRRSEGLTMGGGSNPFGSKRGGRADQLSMRSMGIDGMDNILGRGGRGTRTQRSNPLDITAGGRGGRKQANPFGKGRGMGKISLGGRRRVRLN